MQNRLPASAEDPMIPDFGREVLGKCWSHDPTVRPTMTWCSEVLAWKTTSLFKEYQRDDWGHIPPEYETRCNGLKIVFNPDSRVTLDFTISAEFNKSMKRCVLSYDAEYGLVADPHL